MFKLILSLHFSIVQHNNNKYLTGSLNQSGIHQSNKCGYVKKNYKKSRAFL